MSTSSRPALGRAAALALVPLLLVTGCDLVFRHQEVRLRIDPERDTADLLLIYRGLTTPSEDAVALEKGVRAVEQLHAGRREFILVEWPLHFRLDDLAADARATLARDDASPLERQTAADALAVLDHVELLETGLFLGPGDQLCGYQQFRLTGVVRALAILNAALSREVLARVADGRLTADPELDPRTIELWVDHAAAGRPWVRLEGSRVILASPVSAEDADRAREGLAQSLQLDENFAVLAPALARITGELSFLDGRVRLVLTPDRAGRFDLQLDNPRRPYHPALLEELRGLGWQIPARSLVEVRELVP